MNIQFIENLIDDKICINESKIIFTFYELRIIQNLSEEEMYNFISLANTRLKNLGYNTYKVGQRYYYGYRENIVKENELLIAIKNKEVQNGNREKFTNKNKIIPKS